MCIEKSTNRRERPKEVEAEPLVGNHERDNTGGAEHLLQRAQEPDRVGNVLEDVACDKCVESAVQLARNGRLEGTVRPDEVDVPDARRVDRGIVTVLLDKLLTRPMIDDRGKPTLGFRCNRTCERAKF